MTMSGCGNYPPLGKEIYHRRRNYFFCSFCILFVSPELLLLLLANMTNTTMYISVRSGKIDSLISIGFLYELI